MVVLVLLRWMHITKFMRTGISCIAHTDSHFQIMGAGLLSKNSVVIGISHSGSNKGLLEALEVAKARVS